MKKFHIENNQITLGEYPQSKVLDENLINILNKLRRDNIVTYENKKYLYYEDEYFLFEPLLWDVILLKDTVAYLATHKVIDVRRFDDETASFLDSSLRYWLNNEFITMTNILREDILYPKEPVGLLTKEDFEKYDISPEIEVSDYASKNGEIKEYWLSTETPYRGRVYSSSSWEFSNHTLGIRSTIYVETDLAKPLYGLRYLSNASIPLPKKENGYLYFGLYPSSLVEDEALKEQLHNLYPDEEGYIFYHDKWYKKYCYTHLHKGEVDFYLLEPIKWRIIEEDDYSYLLLSEYCLEAGKMKPLYYQSDLRMDQFLFLKFIPLAFLNHKDLLMEFRGDLITLLEEEDLNLDNQYFIDRTTFFKNEEELEFEATPYASTKYDEDHSYSEDNRFYWLINIPEGYSDSYLGVNKDGSISTYYFYEVGYIRPIIKIKK